MAELKVSGRQVYQGGQYAGTRPQIMRVEWIEHDQPMVAIEMFVGGQVSQHRARDAAVSCIDLLLAELRLDARPTPPETP